MLEIRELGLEGVLELVPARYRDTRGFFSETYNRETFHRLGILLEFVQDNHSWSREKGALRGLHYQEPPFAQDKLVRVTRGRIFDVAVDIRKNSATRGQWVGVEVSAERWNQVLVPKGYAHGFVTLEPDTEVQYKVTAPYSQAHDRGIRYNDPNLDIAWPLPAEALILSEKDGTAPYLADVETGF